MDAWRISIWCWVIFVLGMIGLMPALLLGVPVLIIEQAMTWSVWGYGMYLSMSVIRGGDKHLAKRGTTGTARVLSAKRTNTVVQEGEFAWQAPWVWKYGLEVTLPGREPYKTMLHICAQLSEGETIPVRVSKLNRKRVTIDPGAYNQQYNERTGQETGSVEDRSDGADAAAIQEFVNRAKAASAATREPDVADELEKLAALRDKGILTDSEFDSQKAKLLAR